MGVLTSLLMCACIVFTLGQDRRNPPYFLGTETQDMFWLTTDDSPQFRCKAGGIPTPTVEWVQTKSLAPDLSQKTMIPVNGFLPPNKFNAGMQGDYQCVAKNIYGTAVTNTIRLRMAQSAKFDNNADPIVVTRDEGEPLMIDCTMIRKSAPIALYEWSVHKDANSDKPVRYLTRGWRMSIDNNGVFYFAYLQQADDMIINGVQWTYMCYVSNPVIQARMFGSPTNINVKVGQLTPRSPSRPQTLPIVQEIHILEKDDLDLFCFFYGYPKITYKWTKTTVMPAYIPEYDGTHIVIKGVRDTLPFNGEYKCTGKNTQGEASITYRVIVDVPPYFDKNPLAVKDTNATEGSTIEFKCIALGKPLPTIEWRKNNVLVTDQNKGPRVSFTVNGNKGSYKIEKVRRGDDKTASDLSVITCYAKNSIGERYGNGYINVFIQVCDQTFMSTPKGNFSWPKTGVRQTARVKCPYQPPNNEVSAFATRKCIFGANNGHWENPNLSACLYTSAQTRELQDLAKETVSQDNVNTVTERLATVTNERLSFVDVDLTTNIIDNVLKSRNAFTSSSTQNKTVVNLARTISNTMDASAAVLLASEKKGTAVTRLVNQVDRILKSAKLFESPIKTFGSANLALAAVDSNQAAGGDVSIVLRQLEVDDKLTNDKAIIQIGGAVDALAVDTFLTIPSDLALEFRNETTTFALYRTDVFFQVLDRESKNFTNSRVVVANIGDRVIHNLSSAIRSHFNYINKIGYTNPQCVFWDFALAEWSGAGCRVAAILSDGVSCECNHLTNFALLMDLTGDVVGLDPTNKLIQSVLTYIGCAMSFLALLFTVLTHFLFKKMMIKDYPSKILMNLSFSIMLSNLIFISSSHYARDDMSCKVIAGFLHYFILTSICWMAVEAFFLFLTIWYAKECRRHWPKLILKFAIFGWGLPLIVVAITAITLVSSPYSYGLQHHEGDEGMCWLGLIPLYAAFVAPLCCMLVFNFGVFGYALWKIHGAKKETIRSNQDKKSISTQLRGAAGLAVLFGLTWVFGLLNVESVAVVFSYLFIAFNTLQGVFIFLFYILLNKKARDAWAKKCGRCMAKKAIYEVKESRAWGGYSRRRTRGIIGEW